MKPHSHSVKQTVCCSQIRLQKINRTLLEEPRYGSKEACPQPLKCGFGFNLADLEAVNLLQIALQTSFVLFLRPRSTLLLPDNRHCVAVTEKTVVIGCGLGIGSENPFSPGQGRDQKKQR
jgi:hypothetical protein